jgi:ABC-type sugar transport system ATPase subunit
MMGEDLIIKAKNISKQFPGVLALDNVNFNLKKGEVHAIVGENGAGKSTLINIFGGVYKPDGGNIYIDDKKVKFNNPIEAKQQGIGIVFQELSLFQELSVAENIFVNVQPTNKVNLIKFEDLYNKAKKMLEIFGEEINPKTHVEFISIAKQQVVEIVRAMSNNPRILILDEPTSSLNQAEIKLLFKNIKILRQKGIAIIYISHHLQEIFEIADRATVLRDGKYVDTVDVSRVDENKIARLMVGRKVLHHYIPREDKINRNEILFKVGKLTHNKYFENISFDLHKGEIIGFAGLIGSGRTEIAKAIFGVEKIKSGKIYIEGKEILINCPEDAKKYGIVYTTEDRKQEGVFLEMDIRENCIAPQLEKFVKPPLNFLNEKKIYDYSKEMVEKFNIITPSVKKKIEDLSGGNQQKVLLSMWLGIKPRVVIVDEPTKGVDIGAKGEIYDILRSLANKGVGIIIISSDLPEILTISDKVIVMREGKIVASFINAQVNEEKIIAYATGVFH